MDGVVAQSGRALDGYEEAWGSNPHNSAIFSFLF